MDVIKETVGLTPKVEKVEEPIIKEEVQQPIVEEQKVARPNKQVNKPDVSLKKENVAPQKKYFETDDYRNDFGEETPEVVKTYKTKYAELEPKLKEYEGKLSEYEKNKIEFANENIKRLNDLAKAGKEITPKTVAFLNRDFTKSENPLELLAESLKEANPKWTDKEIQFELRQKYNLDKIKQGLDEYGEPIALTPEQEELKEISEIKMKRDAEEAAQGLIAKQNEFQFVKQPTQADIDAAEKVKADNAKAWDETVQRVSKENKKIDAEFKDAPPIDVFGTKVKIAPFSYEPTKEEKERADSFLHNPDNLWRTFAEKDGTLSEQSYKKIHQVMSIIASGDNFINKLAESKFLEAVDYLVKNDKKINFEPQNKQKSEGQPKKLKLVQK